MSSFRLLVILIAPLFFSVNTGAEEEIPPSDERFQWFTLPIEVSGIPPNAQFLPVTLDIDFTSLLESLQVEGTVDEAALRLFALFSDGSEKEIPYQFRSHPQRPAPERHFLPETSPGVSYITEFNAGESSHPVRVAGELHWISRSPPSGITQEYRLDFGVPTRGRVVQVPYPPFNLRGFDEESRATPPRWFARMQIRPQWPFAGKVNLYEKNERITSYYTGPLWGDGKLDPDPVIRRPFFYPVYNPDGLAVTEFGKPHDPTGSHAHHYSLWIAHADVDGHDFWSESGGVIAHEQFDLLEDGPLFSRIIQRTRWVHSGEAVLRETRTLTFYRSEDNFRVVDFDLDFSTPESEPVHLGATSFGFLAARAAQSMAPFDGGGEIVNSEGDRNEQGLHRKYAHWIDQSGPVAPGKKGGIALLDHPSNPHHPARWHSRNDGWAGPSFNMDQAYIIEHGTRLTLRYRVILHSGAADSSINLRYREFITAPKVRAGAPSSAQRGELSDPGR